MTGILLVEYYPLADEKIGYLLVFLIIFSGIFLFIDGLIQFTKTAQVFGISNRAYKMIGTIFLLTAFWGTVKLYSWFDGIKITSSDTITIKYLWPRRDVILNNKNIESFKIILNKPKSYSASQQLKIFLRDGKTFLSVGFGYKYHQSLEKIISELRLRGIPEGEEETVIFH